MIPFVCTDLHHPHVRQLIDTFALTPATQPPPLPQHYLCWAQDVLSLRQGSTQLVVDFVGGAMRHRRHYGGGVKQALAKALGVTSRYQPYVLDATAGLGKDAFILATLGCHVTMLERSPIAAALLSDGLARARITPTTETILSRMQLIHIAAQDYCTTAIEQYDVVYLDPMFPTQRKSALPKKDMQAFQAIIGADADSDTLLPLARRVARKRVVVKRAISAPYLNAEPPHYSLTGKSTRFDIYLPHS